MLIVGKALARRGDTTLLKPWGIGRSLSEARQKLKIDRNTVKELEKPVEALVSEYIGRMPFLWLDVNDEPGPDSKCGFIERNAIALLSGYNCPDSDAPSSAWLGHFNHQ